MGIYKRYFKKYRVLFFTAIFCVFLEAICDLLQPTVMAHIIDEGIKSNQISIILHYGIIMLVITVLGACFATARSILASKVSQSYGADLRYDVFHKIMRFSETSADKIESGSLITRLTNDTAQIVLFINGMMRIFFKAPVTCIGSIILAVVLSLQLGWILFFVVAVVAFLIVASMKLSYVRFAKVQKAVDRVNTVVQEYLTGVRLVKAFGRYSDEEKKFDEANLDLTRKSTDTQLVIAYFSPLLSLAVNLGIAGIVYAGSLLFNARAIEVGKVAAFINYMAQILASLLMITNVFNTFVRTKASTERINEVLQSEEDSSVSAACENPGASELTFEHVTFAYPNGSGLPAVKDLSFEVGRGETMAVIGPTGSGKSTLAWLCLHFYDADSGSIRIGGLDIRSLGNDAVRGLIALAPQKSMLFTGTVFENITWGNPNASLEDAKKAARLTEADGFIKSMPGGYDAVLGQSGVNLSGGQKQRISIARALAKSSPILILDDCTSALDAVTEAKIRRSLKTLEDNKTIVMITQRIGTAMFADKILVLDNGESVGFGSHAELLATCKTYKAIYDSQIGGDD